MKVQENQLVIDGIKKSNHNENQRKIIRKSASSDTEQSEIKINGILRFFYNAKVVFYLCFLL